MSVFNKNNTQFITDVEFYYSRVRMLLRRHYFTIDRINFKTWRIYNAEKINVSRKESDQIRIVAKEVSGSRSRSSPSFRRTECRASGCSCGGAPARAAHCCTAAENK